MTVKIRASAAETRESDRPSGQTREERAFVFVDESGTLQGRSQRFFALGLLKLKDTAGMTEIVHSIFQRAVGDLRELSGGFEFKFSQVSKTTLPYYLELLDAYFSLPERHFCALVIDKERMRFNWQAHFDSVWDAYIAYSRLMLGRNVGAEQVCVLADYLGKPRNSPRFYEHEVGAVVHEPGFTGDVFGVCMLESEASLLIQTVDVILGAVRYDFQFTRVADGAGNTAKIALTQKVRDRLGWPSLATPRTQPGIRYFSVQELQLHR